MNYIKLLFLIVFVSWMHTADAQITIMPGTTMSVLQSTTLTLPQDLTLSHNATLVSDGSIVLQGGSFSDTGSAIFTANSSLTFEGSDTQNLYSAAPITIASLIVDNPNGIAPQNSVTITHSLGLINGIYYADSTTPVSFSDTAASPIETNSSRIVGKAIMNARALGTNPLSFLGCNISFGTDIGDVTIIRNSGPDAVINVGPGVSIAQNWMVNSTNSQVTPNRNLSFSWLSALDNGRDITAMYLYGSPAPYTNFTAMNDTATNVSATDPRVYFRPNINQFDYLYTLSDNKPEGVNNVVAPIAKITGFPNPFSNEINLSITKNDNQPVHIQMMDVAGRVVVSNTYAAGNTAVITIKDVAKLSTGTYLLHVYNDNFANTLKVVKTN